MIVRVRAHLNMDPVKAWNQFVAEILFGCGKNRAKTGIKTTLWGVPFPSAKSVQNEHFYIILFNKKFGVIVFQFWDDSTCTY